MEDQHLKGDADGTDGKQADPGQPVLQDLEVVRADEVKGGGRRLTDITDGTSNTILVGEQTK